MPASFTSESDRPIPADLAAIPGPRIGYVGALITMRLDLPLLEELARSRPAWSFVLVGWEDEAFSRSLLHNLPNVYFLGRKRTATTCRPTCSISTYASIRRK